MAGKRAVLNDFRMALFVAGGLPSILVVGQSSIVFGASMILVAVIRCLIRFIAGKPEPGQLHSQKCSKPNNNVPNIVTR